MPAKWFPPEEIRNMVSDRQIPPEKVCGCGPEEYECHTDLCLRIELYQRANYVYPPAILPPGGDLGRYDKVVTGTLNVEAKKETRIGPVKIAWEVWHRPKQGGEEEQGEVLARYEAVVRDGDSTVPQGASKMPFALTVTHLLPPYTATPFGTTLNRVFASILEPVPDYTKIYTQTSIDGHENGITPSPRGSIAEYRRRSSRQNGSPAGSSISVDSPEAMRSITPVDPTDQSISQAGGLVARLRFSKPATPKQPGVDYDSVEFPPTFALSSKFARAWRLDLLPLPPSLQPSMVSTDTACGVISCPDRPGEMPSMDWIKSMRIKGLGQVDISIYSAYFACGSGVDFQVDFSDLNPLATIQSIQLSIAELTVAGDGCQTPGQRDEIWFTMFTMGNPDPHAKIDPKNQKQDPSDSWVWRGGVPASYDRLSTSPTAGSSTSGFLSKSKAKLKKKEKPAEIDTIGPPMYHPAIVDTATDESFTLRTQCRLPSPIVGIHASSPALMDPRISRVTHRLRVDVLFSVLGQDESDNPLPNPAKSTVPPEGTVRRLWVEHSVALRVCMLTPDSTIIPPYHSLSESTESLTDYLARIQIRQKPSAFTVPNSRGGRLNLGEGSNDLRERTEEHIDDCQARCLCFYGDNAVFDLIAKKEAGAETAPAEEADGSKAVYSQAVDEG